MTTTGGEYFLVPSVPGLRVLAGLPRTPGGPPPTSGETAVDLPEQVGAAPGDAGEPMSLGRSQRGAA